MLGYPHFSFHLWPWRCSRICVDYLLFILDFFFTYLKSLNVQSDRWHITHVSWQMTEGISSVCVCYLHHTNIYGFDAITACTHISKITNSIQVFELVIWEFFLICSKITDLDASEEILFSNKEFLSFFLNEVVDCFLRNHFILWLLPMILIFQWKTEL